MAKGNVKTPTLIRIPGASDSIASRPGRLIAKVDNILGWFDKFDPAKQSDEDSTNEKEE